MSHITTQQLSEMAGITKRHCQRLLIAGHVPDAVRTSGGHWSIPDNAKVRKWIAKQKNNKHERKAVAIPPTKANQIKASHSEFVSSIDNAKEKLNAVMMACVEIGGHIAEIPRGQRMAWLRDNCPKLSHKQIAAYLSIANTYKKRKGKNVIDRRFFKMLDIVPHKKPSL